MSTLDMLKNCVGDFPIVWEIVYEYDHQVRVPDPSCSMDTIHSHFERRDSVYHIVAPNEAMVRAVFAWKNPRYELKTIKPLCSLNYTVPT